MIQLSNSNPAVLFLFSLNIKFNQAKFNQENVFWFKDKRNDFCNAETSTLCLHSSLSINFLWRSFRVMQVIDYAWVKCKC